MFVYPLLAAFVVVSVLDSFSDNDIFAVYALRDLERSYVSRGIDNIELVTFDRSYTHGTPFPESRTDIFELCNILVERGAKLVVLDYLFGYSDKTVEIPKTLTDKIVVGSEVARFGSSVEEIPPPKHLFPEALIKKNWGDVSVFDTIDRYGAINSLIHYYKLNGNYYPSLSLMAYHKANNDGDSYALRKHGTGIPKQLQDNTRYWLTVPNNLGELKKRQLSAWEIEDALHLHDIDLKGKVVFLASTWDVKKDHFYLGANSTGTFLKRVLNWSGFAKSNGIDDKVPGVWSHIVAYLNLVDKRTYLHPADQSREGVSLLLVYFFIFATCVFFIAIYYQATNYLIRKGGTLIEVKGLAILAAGFIGMIMYFSALTMMALLGLSLSLTLWFLLSVVIIFFLAARGLDNVKSNKP